ncbi:MAG: glucuronate isomerase [Prolixibacteraceae bacterium]
MSKIFIHDNFLLESTIAEQLYHQVACKLPIIDYHNHINPQFLLGINSFENIFQLWLRDDPYKHRAMRILGVNEQLITGNSSDKEKFLQWSKVLPKTIGNPLFHWSCLELKRFFGIDEILSENNAEDIWVRCNKIIQNNQFNIVELLKRMNVEVLCTSDDLLDNLKIHQSATEFAKTITVKPSLRADSLFSFDKHWIVKLSQQTNINIESLESYKKAIQQKLDLFDNAGCIMSDHSLDSGFIFISTKEHDADKIFKQIIKGETISTQEKIVLNSYLLDYLGQEYASRDWSMQLHIGAKRDTNSLLRIKIGSAGGYASLGDSQSISSLIGFLDGLSLKRKLPKTILFNLNPADNAKFATLMGSFPKEGVSGNLQFGPAWWYNDHYQGNINQLTDFANYGIFGSFIGMTTDSRSILSFSRHEYFRRILCNQLGIWVTKGHVPADFEMLKEIVEGVSYKNINNWLYKKYENEN